MDYIHKRISGIPYPWRKKRGDLLAPKRWTDQVVVQTRGLPKIKEACLLRITYFIPKKNIPTDYPFGPDLDNLNKRFLDALSKTVFEQAPGKDSCVVILEAMKTIVETPEQAGALIEILPIRLTVHAT